MELWTWVQEYGQIARFKRQQTERETILNEWDWNRKKGEEEENKRIIFHKFYVEMVYGLGRKLLYGNQNE